MPNVFDDWSTVKNPVPDKITLNANYQVCIRNNLIPVFLLFYLANAFSILLRKWAGDNCKIISCDNFSLKTFFCLLQQLCNWWFTFLQFRINWSISLTIVCQNEFLCFEFCCKSSSHTCEKSPKMPYSWRNLRIDE